MVEKSRRDVLQFSGALIGGIAAGSTVTAAESSDTFLVEAKKTSARKLERAGLSVVADVSEAGFFVVEGAETDLKSTKADYAPDIELSFDGAVERQDVAGTDVTARDEPSYPIQWDKQVQDLPAAHDVTTGDGATISIIDSGVAADHPDLNVNEELSRNFTGDGLGAANAAGGYHGTHVAGIAAAADNGEGVIGTAPDAELVDCRVFSPSAGASFASILGAVAYSAAIGADVANLSLGAYPIPRQSLGSFYGKLLNSVMTYANKEGTLLSIAAGNDSADLQHDKNLISLPNEGAQALSVAATGPIGFGWDPGAVGDESEPADSPATYTNYGTNAITLSAPGGDFSAAGADADLPYYLDLVFNTISIPSYETDDEGNVTGIESTTHTYSWLAGTSMAAPQVAGAAALVKSAAPGLNANQVESLLKRTATSGTGGKEFHGSGFLNVTGALDEL